MGLMDRVRQVMKGRSATLERGIDGAVERIGRYSEALKQQAETAKAKARTLDPERSEAGGALPSAAMPAGDPGPAGGGLAPPVSDTTGLRGDLVDDADAVAPPPVGDTRPDPGPTP